MRARDTTKTRDMKVRSEMSTRPSNRRQRLSVFLSVLAFAGIAMSVMASRPVPREIVLVAKDMAFYLPGDPTSNPTIELRPNERVRLRFVNQDRGIDHDWVVESLSLAIRVLRGDGSSDQILITAPSSPGRHDYSCSLHDKMITGILEVVRPLVAVSQVRGGSPH